MVAQLQNAIARAARVRRDEAVPQGGVRALLEKATVDVNFAGLREGHGACRVP